jgi:hypothetical protein
MKRSFAIALGSAALGAALIAGGVGAQGPPPSAPSGQMPPEQRPHGPMPGGMHGQHHPAAGGQMQPGQDAFAAIAEVVRILEFDPSTDWSRVDLERLRQHLIDMNEVVLRAAVKATPVTGGLAMDITGSGRTAQSIGEDRAHRRRRAADRDRARPLRCRNRREDPGPGIRGTARTGRSSRAAPSRDGQGRAAGRTKALRVVGPRQRTRHERGVPFRA